MARKFNTQFLTQLGLGALVIIGGITFAAVFLVHKNADPMIAAGDAAVAAQHWADAEADYAAALKINHDNEGVWIKRGDVLQHLVESQPELVGQDRAAWQQALEINPNSVPALQRLIASYNEESRYNTESSVNLEKERDDAEKLYALKPDDVYAETASYLVTIQAWLVGVQTDTTTINDAANHLLAISQADPTQSDPPYFVARAHIKQGAEASAQNNQVESDAAYAAAEKVMADAVKAVEDLMAKTDDANMAKTRNGAAEILWRAAQIDADLSNSVGIDATTKSQYIKAAQVHINRALALVSPDAPNLVEMTLAAKEIDLALGNRQDAEKIMRALYAQKKDDQNVRNELARLLSSDPNELQEAIDILEKPQAPNEGQRPQLVQRANQIRLETAAELATLQITQLDSTSDPAQRTALINQAKSEYETLYRTSGENLQTLKLKGEIALAEGRGIDAVQALSRALTSISNAATNDELQEFLGRAYEATHQDTRAQQCYTLVVSHHPDFYPALIRLTRMLIVHKDPVHADEYLKNLELHYPDDVPVMTLRLAWLDLHRAENKDEIDRKFTRIPEATDAQRMSKVQLAAGLGRADDMARLLTTVMNNEPNNVSVAVTLAKFFVQTNNIDLAKQVVANSLKVNPDSPDLQVFSAELNGATSDDLLKLERQIYSKTPDPFERALQLEALDVQAGDLHDAELELQAALTIKPDDGRVWDALFNVYVSQGKLDEATSCIPKLEHANQDQAGGLLYRFRIAMARKDFDGAVKLATEMVQELPQLAGVWLSLGQAQQAMGEPEKAILNYEQATERQSDNPLALSGLIECNYRLGNNTEALNYIQEAVKDYPDDPTWLQMEIRHYLQFGPLTDAEPLLLQQVTTRQATATPATVSQLIAVELQLAREYQAGGDTKDAGTFFDRANTIIGQARSHWPDEPRFYTLEGASFLMAGKYKDGEDAIRQLALRDAWKNKPDPYTILADYQLSAGQLADAETSLRTARTQPDITNDQSQAIRQQLANVLGALGKIDEALAMLGDSAVPAIRNQRINMDISAGRVADAEKEIKIALANKSPDIKPEDANTDSADLLSQLAGIEFSRGDIDQASANVSLALLKIPTHAMSLYYRGSIKLRATPPDVEGAIADLTAARQQLPTNPRIHGVLAEAFREKDDFESERRELDIGVQQAPADKIIRLQLIQADIDARPQRLTEAVAEAEDIRKNPQFAKDLEFLGIESHLLTQLKQYTLALQANALALQVSPNDASLISEQMGILLASNDFSGLESTADTVIQAVNKPAWWMYDYRATARAHLSQDGAKDDMAQALNLAHAEPDLSAMQQAVLDMCKHLGGDVVDAFLATNPPDDLRWKLAIMAADLARPETKSHASEVAGHVASSADFDKLTKDQQVYALRLVEAAYIAANPPMEQEAADVDRKILTIIPTDVATLNNLANRLVAIDPKGNIKEALAKSTQAASILQQSGRFDPQVMDTLGWMQVLSGSNQDAVHTLRPLFDSTPDLSICVHLANAYVNLSDPQQAQQVIEKGTALIAPSAATSQPIDSDLRAQFDEVHKKADDLQKPKVDAGTQ